MVVIHHGAGIMNSVINKLPFELHVPGYQYCGPGTKLEKRLLRGDPGINDLDRACKSHDIAYSQNKDLKERHKADKILEEAAWSRVKSKSATFGEKATASAVRNTMKMKRKLGMGLKKKRMKMLGKIKKVKKSNRRKRRRRRIRRKKRGNLKKKIALRKAVVEKVRNSLKKFKHLDLNEGSNIALAAAKESIKASGGRCKIRTPRIIPIPKRGGFLPLIPLFAGLSALGALSGGAAGIAKAVNDSKAARQKLEESQRHNQTMEAIALGNQSKRTRGGGLYLKPYRKGLGLFLNQTEKKKN